jgi:hypothetical protein
LERLVFLADRDWPSWGHLHRALERLNFFRSVTSRFSTGCLRAAYSD